MNEGVELTMKPVPLPSVVIQTRGHAHRMNASTYVHSSHVGGTVADLVAQDAATFGGTADYIIPDFGRIPWLDTLDHSEDER